MSSFPEQRIISLEVYRYPYSCDPADEKVYLSEKICYSIIKTRKKAVNKTKVLLCYGQLLVSLGSGLIPAQQIGLPPLLMNSKISRANTDLSKQIVITQVNYIMPTDIDFTKDEINQLYNFSIQHRNNCLSKDELLTKINSLRGGDYVDVALAWKRLEAGIHTQDDVTWIKHECAERHHELKYDSGYSEAHERAQSLYDGYPWENKF